MADAALTLWLRAILPEDIEEGFRRLGLCYRGLLLFRDLRRRLVVGLGRRDLSLRRHGAGNEAIFLPRRLAVDRGIAAGNAGFFRRPDSRCFYGRVRRRRALVREAVARG